MFVTEVIMKFVSVRDFRSKSAQVWKNLKSNDEMVITSNGRPMALLTSLSDDNLEQTLQTIRKAKAMAAVSSMQLKSLQSGNNKMSLTEINREIALQRKEKTK
jgi:antitoxin (DNA-binding transcriptional repressor) of toxin-antitoxin stability system